MPHHGGTATELVGWVAVVVVVLPALAYLRAVRARRAAGRPWPRWRTAVLVVALLAVALVVSPPGQALLHADDRFHMAGHLVVGMLAPLGIVLAAPGTLVLGALPLAARRPAAVVLRSRTRRVLAHPAVAALLDMGGLYLLYLTPLVGLAAADPVLGRLVDLHVLLAGCLFTWSIVGPDPAPGRPSIATRAVVLVLAGAAHGYLAKLLLIRGDVSEGAAEVMFSGGDVVEVLLAVVLFAAWYRGSGALRPAPGHRRPPVPAAG